MRHSGGSRWKSPERARGCEVALLGLSYPSRETNIEVTPTRIDSAHAIAHNMVMIIYGETVITGSFNFTKAAEEHNAQNLLIMRNAGVTQIYLDNWEEHMQHSEKTQ